MLLVGFRKADKAHISKHMVDNLVLLAIPVPISCATQAHPCLHIALVGVCLMGINFCRAEIPIFFLHLSRSGPPNLFTVVERGGGYICIFFYGTIERGGRQASAFPNFFIVFLMDCKGFLYGTIEDLVLHKCGFIGYGPTNQWAKSLCTNNVVMQRKLIISIVWWQHNPRKVGLSLPASSLDPAATCDQPSSYIQKPNTYQMDPQHATTGAESQALCHVVLGLHVSQNFLINLIENIINFIVINKHLSIGPHILVHV